MRRWLPIVVVVLAACSPGDDAASSTSVASTTTSTTATTTSSSIPPATTLTTPPPSREELAIAAAREAVRAAGVMTAEFVETAIAEVNSTGDAIEVVLLPPNPETLGATAVVTLDADDLTVLEVHHYR